MRGGERQYEIDCAGITPGARVIVRETAVLAALQEKRSGVSVEKKV